MEYFAALGLALAIWVPPLFGYPALTTTLGAPLVRLLGPILAGSVAGAAVAGASALTVAVALVLYEQLAYPEGVTEGARSAHDLMILPLTRQGNELPALIAALAPLLLLLKLLLADGASSVVGELMVLAVVLCLAGVQSLRPTDYRGELLPGALSLGRRLGHLTRRGEPAPPQEQGPEPREEVPTPLPDGPLVSRHLEGEIESVERQTR